MALRRFVMTRRSTLAGVLLAAAIPALVACQLPSTQQGGQRAANTGATTAGAATQARAQAGAGVPSGTIVAYYGTDIPLGWILCDGRVTPNGLRTPDLRNRFIMGLDPASRETLGAVGGTASHQHSAETSNPRGERERIESGNDEHAANDEHTHPVTVHPASHLPPYVKLVYIMKD
jgi:hypothetical protein